MVILTPMMRETFQVFKGKARAHSCPDLSLGDRSNMYGLRPWYADTREERDGLSHRCLPYYQRWTHWASVKCVKKTWRVYLSIGVRITMILSVVYLLRIFKMFHGVMNNPVYWVIGKIRCIVCEVSVCGGTNWRLGGLSYFSKNVGAINNALVINAVHKKNFLLWWYKKVLSSWFRMIENRMLRKTFGPRRGEQTGSWSEMAGHVAYTDIRDK
jgi:hypothetical protein